ncbi:MAG: hypothetical protein KF753_17170 [Caldilineaceae bacterium]|nr:hypothetical protein [Caldilineaceae bacterium]
MPASPHFANRFAVHIVFALCVFLASFPAGPSPVHGQSSQLPNPILFVTQFPITADFTTIGSVFGNHQASMDAAGRGGDLWIRYPDGSQKNLTAAAGYGSEGMQGANAIAVRDPSVHWNGTKALFSMAIGAPTQQYQVLNFYWQLYEITGLGQGQTPVITKVPNQPANFNNISPIYGTDDRIIFTTDRPRSGERHLYPQLDEYEEAPTVSGLWSLDPATGDLFQLNHAPSGDFTPSIDSYGRVIFTQWDHLQRDQQADGDNLDEANGGSCGYCTFNYSSEAANAVYLSSRAEVYPEPRADRDLVGTNLWGHTINHFFPWTINEDGTESEVLNHLGRHELHGYIPPSLTDDPNLVEYYGQYSRFNPNEIQNLLQIREAPTTPGRYYGVDAPEFQTHAAGQIVYLDAPPSLDADHIAVVYVTHRETSNPSENPSANHSGLYRDPLPLSDGRLIATHTAETRADRNEGSTTSPRSRYDFRLRFVADRGDGIFQAGAAVTAGISKTISFWSPDVKVSYSGPLWELQPVEVRARVRPPRFTTPLQAPEQQIFAEEGVALADLQAYMRQRNLALAVSRNVTARDDFDTQQPFNLRVRGGGAETIGKPGKVYEIAYMQLFQADQIRGLNYGNSEPRPGRRVLAQWMHDAEAVAANTLDNDVPAAVEIAPDGSMAAFVPARRAMSWQLTDGDGTGVVRERYWLTFQPGEVRVCAACHGLSDKDQQGNTAPQNPPEALRQLLKAWKAEQPVTTPTATATATTTVTPTPIDTITKTPTPSATAPVEGTPTATPTPASAVYLPRVRR